ncbi:MAG: hypothetical protein WBL63_22825 [Candidatus Acidiferrum sp.]
MKQRFDLSYGALYLAFVFLGYICVGALGVFSDYPPLQNLMAWFLMVNPHPLLHILIRCTIYFPCTIVDISNGFDGPGLPKPEFVTISAIVFLFGLLGLVAVSQEADRGVTSCGPWSAFQVSQQF